MKVEVHGSFSMSVEYIVNVPDSFSTLSEEEQADALTEALDDADFVEIVNANGGGEWEVERWEVADPAQVKPDGE